MKPQTPPKTYRVKSFGCQMNAYDGERMSELLIEQGHRTCFRMERSPISSSLTLAIFARKRRRRYIPISAASPKPDVKSGMEPLIAVAGCVAQAEGEEIMARAPAVSMVVGPQAYHRLPEMLDRAVARANGRPTPTCLPSPSSRRFPERTADCASRLPDRAGGVRQVLHLLRGALIRGARKYRDRYRRSGKRSAESWWRRGRRRSRLLGQNVSLHGRARTGTATDCQGLDGPDKRACPDR